MTEEAGESGFLEPAHGFIFSAMEKTPFVLMCLKPQELREMIERADSNGDGQITPEDSDIAMHGCC